jgi:FkbM family methyltransferase
MNPKAREFFKKLPFAESARNILLRARKNVSFSQCGEDLIARFFLPKKFQGFYVDIGANDPVYFNNTYLFYRLGWSGLCVEPNRRRCGQIKKVRGRDEILNFGSGKEKGEKDFFNFDPDTLSTFSPAEAGEFQKLGHKLLTVEKVKVVPLGEILETFGKNRDIDLLSIDTEGLDLEILQSNNWQKFRPALVVAETAEYRKEEMVRINRPFDGYMKGLDYIKLADTYINGIYMEGGYARKLKMSSITE